MDTYLAAIVQRAEADGAVPPLRLVLTSGDIVSGIPVRSIEFDVAMESALAREYERDISRSGARRAGLDAGKMAEAALAVLDEADEELAVVTLSPATMDRAGGAGGLELPALRVAVTQIAAWWVTGAKELRAGRSWGFGLGVIIPTD
jgi:hypothetical protein